MATPAKRPRNILKLDETVVNRIAAGEIIQRPANALKEMLENSLDAGSTSIQVTVKDGGLKLLKIQDNGHGINKEDFTIVCERFTTSKLQKFEDLTSIGTFGFRGEALASISHVAHLTIITKTVEMQCAYKCSYTDGKLTGTPKPCAGTQGTQIIVEDLFYNVPTRKNALKSPAEEYNRIIEVVTRFAVHNGSVGFCLKKLNDNSADVKTPPNSTSVDNIRLLYGNNVAKSLVQLNLEDPTLKVKANGWISNLDYSGAKFQMLLFINHRLVDSTPLKKALETVYSTYLAKGKHPYVYLSMEIAPNCVDVNVHPTKHEVHFLNEEAIIHKIQLAADAILKGMNTTRSFSVQSIEPISSVTKENANNKPQSAKVYDKDLVRTDSRNQKIEKFLSVTPDSMSSSLIEEQSFAEGHHNDSVVGCFEEKLVNDRMKGADRPRGGVGSEGFDKASMTSKNLSEGNEVPIKKSRGEPERPQLTKEPVGNKMQLPNVAAHMPIGAGPSCSSKESQIIEHAKTICTPKSRNPKLPVVNKGNLQRRTFDLTSLSQLRATVQQNADPVLRDTFKNSIFVGCASKEHALFQHHTRLYVFNITRVAQEFFYQTFLNDFGNLGVIRLSNPPALYDLSMKALDMEENQWTPEDGPKDKLAKQVSHLLCCKSEMLDDYFSLQIDEEGKLLGIPLLLGDYIPDLTQLPSCILRLATDVQWRIEKECFDTFCRIMSQYYWPPNDHKILNVGSDKDWEWTAEHVLFPAIKSSLQPPKEWANDGVTIVLAANLPDLYKVFERC